MLRRSLIAVALCGLAGCQDYNFNPVGKCGIQPGTARVTLSNISTADILFVVDDSGSMSAEQAGLARNFGAFIDALAVTQKQRTAAGLDPLDFHVAVTTSSIFEGRVASGTGSTCAGSPLTCNIQQPTFAWSAPYKYACVQSGAACEDLIQSYYFSSSPSSPLYCPIPGVSSPGQAFPAGNFVALGANPRVLHFTKTLDWSSWGGASPDPNLQALVTQFQQNISVGTCGSGMEQHLQAGRLAVQKALRQNGLTQPTGVDPTEWPHPDAKLVVVWLGDEDDCSNPNDPLKSLVFGASLPGDDVCINDQKKPADQQTLYPVSDFASYFTGLNRPFGAAFIYSTPPSSCQDDGQGNIVCQPGGCACQCPPSCNGACSPTAAGICNIPSDCSGKAVGGTNTTYPGHRFHDFSALLRGQGAQTLEASVCDWDWAKTLQGIAQLVKPPQGLTLPSQPATSQVAVLRIESRDGSSSRYCTGPGQGMDWYFVDCKTGQPVYTTTTSCIAINHATGHCEPNPGESYVAQYLGILPPPTATTPGGCGTPTTASAECSAALGGAPADWKCEVPPGQTRGTCLCQQ